MANGLLILCYFCVAFEIALSRKNLELEKSILDSILSPDVYDSSIRPPGHNGSTAVVVYVNAYVRSISGIDDVNMEYDTQLTFRQSWYDKRLEFDDKRVNYLILTHPEKIWRPDVFFSNEKKAHFHNIVMPNNLIRIFSDGKVLYSTRISLTLSCPMDLRNYPMDNQVCSIRCASYGYTTDDIKFVWKEENPVQLTSDLNLPKFTLKSFLTDYCMSKTTTGEYSCVKIDFVLARETGYYLQHAYMPTIALVILSWVPFWLNLKSTTVRMTICLGVLLAMFIEASTISNSNPPVSYTKAIDIWTGTCLLFVHCVLIMLCVITNSLKADENAALQNQMAMEEALADKSMCIEDGGKRNLHTFTSTPLKWLNRYPTKAQRLDVLCRFLFPAAFAFFNLIYWFSYTSHRMG